MIELDTLNLKVDIVIFDNIDYWFKKETVKELSIIKKYIDNISDIQIREFFLVVFSETVREVSLTRNSEFKLYRIPKEKIDLHNPCVFSILEGKLIRNRNGLDIYGL